LAAGTPEPGAAGGCTRTPAADEYRHPLIVWRFTDGKPGHQNQSTGLLAALQHRLPVEDYLLPSLSPGTALRALLTGRLAAGGSLPAPDLLIGAGHATHLSLLAARRVRGGRTIVLMKPSLPAAWFDLCIIPAHDTPRVADSILVTRGVLNRVRYSADRDAGTGLILLGGPSAHVEWSTAAVVVQVRELLAHSPGVRWTLTTSRRTPGTLLEQLAAEPALRGVVVPWEQTAPDWLPDRLARASHVWVTQDSVSMIYEALTSGAAVGLLNVPWRDERDRLARGVAQLVQDGLVTGFDAWQHGRELQPPAEPFDEAARCAAWIARTWLSGGRAATQAAP